MIANVGDRVRPDREFSRCDGCGILSVCIVLEVYYFGELDDVLRYCRICEADAGE